MSTSLRVARVPDTAEPLLRIHGVTKAYACGRGERVALEGVSLEIAPGEILAVIGASGSGKSTVGLLAAGLEPPSAGRVTLAGVDYETGGAKARRGVATLDADPDLPSGRTVRDILEERRDAAGAFGEAPAEAVDWIIDLLEMHEDAERLTDELSDGARRRAALGRALAGEPQFLVLDEATSALDPEISATFLEALARVTAEKGVSALLISHEMTAVTALARRVVVLDKGRIVEEGTTARVFARPEHPVSRRFAAAATGATLPPFIAKKLEERPSPGGKALIRLAFEGPGATRPVLTYVARELGFDIGILAGSLGAAGGEPYGVLIVAAPSDEPYFTATIERLEDAELGVEVLGFVG